MTAKFWDRQWVNTENCPAFLITHNSLDLLPAQVANGNAQHFPRKQETAQERPTSSNLEVQYELRFLLSWLCFSFIQ